MREVTGSKYKIVMINLNGQLMYLVANANKKGVWAFFDSFEKAHELWQKMEKEV